MYVCRIRVDCASYLNYSVNNSKALYKSHTFELTESVIYNLKLNLVLHSCDCSASIINTKCDMSKE